MQTKLTLRMDDQLVREAKEWARENDTSVSALVAGYLRILTRSSKRRELSDWARSLLGAARVPGERPPDDDKARAMYVEYLAEKYR